MSLEDLANRELKERKLLSWMILEDKQYVGEIKKGLPFFTKKELSEIENNEKHKSGLTFSEINKKLSAKGMILKQPTFKKYITLKLIPDSIGTKKKDKGIVGLYPPKIIRAINFIKYSLYINLNFTDIIDRFFDQFKTTALELIESSFPQDMDLFDFFSTIQGNFNERGEAPPDAMRRCARKLFEKNIIENQKMKEIIKLVETIEDSMDTALTSFHLLKDVLGNISIPGELGFKML